MRIYDYDKTRDKTEELINSAGEYFKMLDAMTKLSIHDYLVSSSMARGVIKYNEKLFKHLHADSAKYWLEMKSPEIVKIIDDLDDETLKRVTLKYRGEIYL